MSRSYRHHPGFYDRNPDVKKIFNRRIRRSSAAKYQDIPNGSAYKKLNDSWEICDYGCCYPFERELFWNHVYRDKETEEELWAKWVKTYYYK